MKPRHSKTGPTAATGRLRIIAGQWRGRKLPILDAPGLRPTPDRVRETVFNWLAVDIQDLRVLDLFAGTGALAFEALSRGAAHAVMVESQKRVADALRTNISTLNADADLVVGDALAFLQRDTSRFDLVFVDPPFQADAWDRVLSLLPAHLNVGHRVYVEAPRSWAGPSDPQWRVLKERAAADVVFRLLDYSGPLLTAESEGDLQ